MVELPLEQESVARIRKIVHVATSTKRLQIYRTLLKVIAHKTVPERSGRSEPRVCKRRPKAYPLMTKPRHELRKQLQTA